VQVVLCETINSKLKAISMLHIDYFNGSINNIDDGFFREELMT
jgi:hypothetical protein